MTDQRSVGSISKARIKMMYRAIIVAIISSILATPVALLISYELSKAKYDRIVDRQVADFSLFLFSHLQAGAARTHFDKNIINYLSEKNAAPSPDASFVYIYLTDEFNQAISEQNFRAEDSAFLNAASAKECLKSYIPIINVSGKSYFCSKTPIVNGHTHYNVYGYLTVSEGVVSDFIDNALVICGITSFLVLAVSLTQYYVSLRVSRVLIKANVKTLLLLGNTIALRDNDTFHHNLRVMIYSYYFGRIVGLAEHEMNDLISGALLHDIGKIGISDMVLHKPGKLTKDEFEVIKSHVALGEQIMINSEWTDGGLDVIKYHHERFDGAGYSSQLKSSDIPIIARIFAIVDVFDAITSARPYKEAKSYEDTMAYLISAKGGHFDPELVDRFIDISRMLYENYANRNDSSVVAEANRILNFYYC